MTYWSFETLDRDMEKMEGAEEGRLFLSQYVTLEPGNFQAEKYLALLEKEGYLPSTVSWLSDEMLKIRLYLAPDGAYPFEVNCDGMVLEVHSGGDDCVLVKSQKVRAIHHKIHGDASFLRRSPSKLPMVTFEFLRLLALMGNEAINLQPAKD